MARRMSCSLTPTAVRQRIKTVTRRREDTWVNLAAGDELVLVEKAQGLRKGERQVVLGRVVVTSVRLEPISAITEAEIVREGVGVGWPVPTWIGWWKLQHGYGPHDDPIVRRIEWRYVDA